MPTNELSPLGGYAAFVNETAARASGDRFAYYDQIGLGRLYLGAYMRDEAANYARQLPTADQPNIIRRQDFADRRKAWDLIRSKVWRAQHIQPSSPFYLLKKEDYDGLAADVSADKPISAYPVEVFESIIEEAKSLPFEEKCLKTLENYFVYSEANQLNGFQLPGMRVDEGRQIFFMPATPPEPANDTLALAYGCNPREATYVYRYLLRLGWIEPVYTASFLKVEAFVISPNGYIEIDRIRRGKSELVNEAFFVRAWDESMNNFFSTVADAVQKRTGCSIRAVWDNAHNGRIDDLILRKIRECPVVVLDVAPERFNVGLEAGYALALGKPIVTIKKKIAQNDPDGKVIPEPPLPFDIATLNCFFYDVDNPDALITTLSERILVGLELSAKS